ARFCPSGAACVVMLRCRLWPLTRSGGARFFPSGAAGVVMVRCRLRPLTRSGGTRGPAGRGRPGSTD
ncbi:hypothetical protein, partial [Nocardia farcinica]|uniref:hypothetical protein n=1 Tax=Nocardia farcinica TaxID=37329 RepID=UPI002457D65C